MKTLLKLTLSAILLSTAMTFVSAESSIYPLESIDIVKSKEPIKLVPSSVLKGKSLLVSYSKYAGKIESISIRDFYGEIIFTDKADYTGNFAQSYNIEKLDAGSYVVIIKTKKETHYNFVRI